MRVFLALLAVATVGVHGAKLPSYLMPRCSRSLPSEELSACAEKLANEGLDSLANGDRKLRIPSMKPLVVPRMSLSQGTDQVGLNLTWEPAEIWGLDKAKVFNMKLKFPEKTNSFDVIIPTFSLTGIYKSTGRVLLLPITGSGPSNITVTNLRVHYTYEWPIKKAADGKEYVTIINRKIDITGADAMQLHFKNLFNGDPLLGNQMNAFLNENWRDLLRELGPGMAEATGEVILLVVKGLADHVPLNEMFSP